MKGDERRGPAAISGRFNRFGRKENSLHTPKSLLLFSEGVGVTEEGEDKKSLGMLRSWTMRGGGSSGGIRFSFEESSSQALSKEECMPVAP